MVRSERGGSLVGTIAHDAATRISKNDTTVAKPFHDIVVLCACQTFSDRWGLFRYSGCMVSSFDIEALLIRTQSGRLHLPLPARIRWFRLVNPAWGIVTELTHIDKERQWAVVRTQILSDNGQVIATSMKADESRTRPDWLESIENGSIERALILAGFQHEREHSNDTTKALRVTETSNAPVVPRSENSPAIELPGHLPSLRTAASLTPKPRKPDNQPSLQTQRPPKGLVGSVERVREQAREYADPGGDDEPTEDEVLS